MKEIIPPVKREFIEAELTEDKYVRHTNNGYKVIYIVTHHDSPNTMQELGRLREISFREGGGGTGKAVDIDEYDTSHNPFKQLIVWSPNDREIVGGYRYIEGYNIGVNENGFLNSPTGRLFSFSDTFINDYLPRTIELGRSFVQPAFQPSFNVRKGIYSLDNLWDGLGALMIDHSDLKYFFGKITMYPSFHPQARDILHYFLHLYFGDKDKLVTPIEPLLFKTDPKEFEGIFSGSNYDEDYKILMRTIREFGMSIPPLVNAYMNLSPSMKVFGTSVNKHFGNVEETGILITIDDIYDIKKDRHVSSYLKNKKKS